MKVKNFVAAGAVTIIASGAWAECAFENSIPLNSLTADFDAFKAVAASMAECGNFEAELDRDYRFKQPAAFAANPSLYHIGGVSNSPFVPLYDQGTIRPLDDLVAIYGQHLSPNQLIKLDGEIWAIAMMVNVQHLMYRKDILDDLGIAVPTTYDEVLDAAAKIQAAGVVDYPLGGTYMSGWNLAQEFVNIFVGEGGEFFGEGHEPSVNNETGIATLVMMKRLTKFMDPEFLVSDSTYVQKQFQQGKIAIANLWQSRAAAMNNAEDSQVVGMVGMASAPMGAVRPASTIWWDGIVIAKNISDEEADAAFRVALEGLDTETVVAHNDAAVWLIDGFVAGEAAAGAAATAANGAVPYPAGKAMGLMHTALGNIVSDYLTGATSAADTLANVEAAYIAAADEHGLL
ncbi:MAG: extracellular solute-binding protein [Albidovulum sp.]|nr:extracellular solute-binding protein [Albidovulum sp.]MDE0529885.1 extracellular solute-binding protein [Albidovulum sp.]